MKLCDGCRSMRIFSVQTKPQYICLYVCGEVGPIYERHRLCKFCLVAQAFPNNGTGVLAGVFQKARAAVSLAAS